MGLKGTRNQGNAGGMLNTTLQSLTGSSMVGMNSTLSYFKKFDAREHKAFYKTPNTKFISARQENQAVYEQATQIDS